MIIAGGVGARIGSTIPKQYIKYEELIWDITKEYHITKLQHIIYVGAVEQESIRNGVFGLEKYYDKNDVLLIHDAIRPLVERDVLEDCIRLARKEGNAWQVSQRSIGTRNYE